MKTVLIKEPDIQTRLEASEDTTFIVIPKGNVSLEVEAMKQGVSIKLIGLYSLKGDGSVILETRSIHNLPNTKCDVTIKAALFDSSRSSYIGKIYIGKEAQQTVSFLEDNVLVLGDNVKNASQPILEILADDVKASHGATTGRLDESAIYYLMARGLTRKEAENLAIEGFFESMLSTISDEKVLDDIRKELYV